MDKIKVLLVEDHTIVRKGLSSILEQDFGIEVTGEADNGREALKKADELSPDVVVLDISLPLLNGLEVCRQLNRQHPNIHILMLTMYESDELVFQSLQAGAKGYLLKKAAPDELISAIYAVKQGKSFFSPEISKMLIERMVDQGESKENLTQPPALTKREREVLQLVAEGYSSREIGNMLNISVKTAENHRAKIMHKLNLNNITELIKYALSKGIIHLKE